MRFLAGLIVGAALTVGGAWLVDANRIGDLGGPIVNWERLDKGWVDVRDSVRAQFRRFMG